jgi:GT2 family glycosyltransferase
VTVVIPTFGREGVLLETVAQVLALAPDGLLVVDQTPEHDAATVARLAAWDAEGAIRWIRLDKPSIPRAMNTGLIEAGDAGSVGVPPASSGSGKDARAPGNSHLPQSSTLEARDGIVLFLDDDIIPSPGLLDAHRRAHDEHPDAVAVIGQILQPGEQPTACGDAFQFCSDSPRWISTAMAGNMSVKRRRAVAVGGFDENFLGAAYMFETEFARRLLASGGKIFFEPSASIRHLRADRGGTRFHGTHFRTVTPAHSSGAYYNMFLASGISGSAGRVVRRLASSVATRHHMRNPWWIPATLVAEIRGLAQALALYLKGPRLLAEKILNANRHETR